MFLESRGFCRERRSYDKYLLPGSSEIDSWFLSYPFLSPRSLTFPELLQILALPGPAIFATSLCTVVLPEQKSSILLQAASNMCFRSSSPRSKYYYHEEIIPVRQHHHRHHHHSHAPSIQLSIAIRQDPTATAHVPASTATVAAGRLSTRNLAGRDAFRKSSYTLSITTSSCSSIHPETCKPAYTNAHLRFLRFTECRIFLGMEDSRTRIGHRVI